MAGNEVSPSRMPMGTTCACHRHRETVPIETHHVWPLGLGGPDTASNKVSVCVNAHYSIHEYMRRLELRRGQVPWIERRMFGRKVRELAERGWKEAGQPGA